MWVSRCAACGHPISARAEDTLRDAATEHGDYIATLPLDPATDPHYRDGKLHFDFKAPAR